MPDENRKNISVLSRFLNKYFSSELEFRVRLFNVLALAGTLGAFTIGCITLITRREIVTTLIDWASAALAYGLMYYAMRSQKYMRCYYITIFVIFLGLFPYLYFSMGGYKGGVPMFFIFAIVLTAFMLEKKAAIVILTVETIVYIGCIIVSFYSPGFVKNFPDERGFFWNNIIDFMVVAVSLGIISLLHFRLYNAQQRILDEQNTILAEGNKFKTEFLANASHEMRTPLTVTSVNVQTVMDILDDMGDAMKDPEAAKLLQSAQNEIMRLSRMVGGMLTLASMTENTDRQKLDLSQLLQNTAEILRLNIVKQGNSIETDVESNLCVFGNADLLMQVFSNILQNAGANTKDGVIAASAKKQGNVIEVTVRDTGVGIPPDLLPRVFERGVSTGGTGYGLYLCKMVVESHGGKIWIESTLDSGTTVYFTLPYYEGQLGGAGQ